MNTPGWKGRIGAGLLALLLTDFLNAEPLRGYDPHECTPEMICTCFGSKATDKIAEEIQYAESCRYALDEYMSFAEKVTTKHVEWYQEPTIIIGGVVLTAGIFGFLGYAVGAGR